MILKKGQIIEIGSVIKGIQNKSEDISISVKYKLLKLEQLIAEEFNLINQLIDSVTIKYGEKDEEGNIKINDDQTIKIDKSKILDFKNEIDEFLDLTTEICDYYFSIEELEKLNLSWQELRAFMPFIK